MCARCQNIKKKKWNFTKSTGGLWFNFNCCVLHIHQTISAAFLNLSYGIKSRSHFSVSIDWCYTPTDDFLLSLAMRLKYFFLVSSSQNIVALCLYFSRWGILKHYQHEVFVTNKRKGCTKINCTTTARKYIQNDNF